MTSSNYERRIQHYNSTQKILLVGEGDFSFSTCLAKAFGCASNVVATSLDSKLGLLAKYETSCGHHLEELENRGCMVLHEINVHDMNRHITLSRMKFDVIVFNFPHAGHVGQREHRLIASHKVLLRAFFASARQMMKVGGEVHVTHRDDYPYNMWMVEVLGREKGLVLKEKVAFRKEDYPGYENKRGGDIRAYNEFPLKDAFTFKFSVGF